MRLIAALSLLLAATAAHAQFDLEESHTTASLRGVDALGDGVAWASGTNGTILRTEDGGYLWQPCTIPTGAEKLDFRGIQGFDANTAVAMASGPGTASAVYKTTDGCQTWKRVFTNPDAKGFFDNIHKVTSKQMYMMGDQVDGQFTVFFSPDRGDTWSIADDPGREADKGDGGFAASNSGLTAVGSTIYFVTGGSAVAHVYNTYGKCDPGAAQGASCPLAWQKTGLPLAAGNSASGAFSIAGRTTAGMSGKLSAVLVAVGGDYQKPDATAGTAAWSKDGGKTWTAATTMPHGYRSAVVFDSATQSWLTAGPNGTDISFDDGKTWKPVAGPTADSWNALSLPFAVGPKGRIGKLRAGVLKP
ncbi:YCF48-related protein [Granulicella tundricola]|uniref:Glycosyl hydrolase n=1 Tax=Granulicella tundricola (strain ATCC BAA-1859 / DSM 23138 / MP5ACTX9) TaxID=1198114 RepID=E8X296_GRATM|nr:YCF48-related protein [Granulicella tundricola]ADW68028.1 glycosyl hydrolase [Granulicella tundricola MP5ACTX9]